MADIMIVAIIAIALIGIFFKQAKEHRSGKEVVAVVVVEGVCPKKTATGFLLTQGRKRNIYRKGISENLW